MVNKKYEKGRNFEYRVKKALEEAGFYVVRSAGSHTLFDLVAFKKGKVFPIQLKINPINLSNELEKLENFVKSGFYEKVWLLVRVTNENIYKLYEITQNGIFVKTFKTLKEVIKEMESCL